MTIVAWQVRTRRTAAIRLRVEGRGFNPAIGTERLEQIDAKRQSYALGYPQQVDDSRFMAPRSRFATEGNAQPENHMKRLQEFVKVRLDAIYR